MTGAVTQTPAGLMRWWTYQRERFPIVANGLLVAAFSFCAVSYSAQLRGHLAIPPWRELIVAFATSFTFFLQLRIADEFKDFEEDLKYRPYRPVQRGLVSLSELAMLFVLCAVLQASLAIWFQPKLLVLLLITWIYLALMSKEFFVNDWLRRRPITYMLSHMVIMPLIDLYASSTDWINYLSSPPRGLIWFLLASYCNGLVIEIGRKVRSPADEENGVQTYSSLWGAKRAAWIWVFVITLTAALGCVAGSFTTSPWLVACMLASGVVACAAVSFAFCARQSPGRGKRIELSSGLWTLLLYLTLGLIPLIIG